MTDKQGVPPGQGGRASGFTLVEVMIAGSLATVLSLVLFEIILQAQYMADQMIMQSTLNSQAREVFDLLMGGGVRPGGIPSIQADRIPGYHGRQLAPAANPATASDELSRREDSSATTDTFRLRLGSAVPGSTDIIRTQGTFPSFGITCTGNGMPVRRCGASGENYTVDGYVDYFEPSAAPIVSGTSELTFTVIDPQRVPRNGGTSRFIKEEYSASFWTVFALNRDL